MNVLFCSPYSSTGGISSWTNHVIDYHFLHNEGIDLDLFYPDIVRNNSLEARGKLKRFFRGLKLYLPFVLAFKKKLKHNKYDIVHFSTSAGISLFRDYLLLKECRQKGIPSVLHFHFGRIPKIMASNGWETRMLKKCIDLTTKVITIDNPSFEILIDYGYDNVEFLPNPLSEKVRRLAENSDLIKRKSGLISFVGHVVPTKGILELVEACKKLKSIELEIIGLCTTEMQEVIKKCAGDNYSSWLKIRGNCSLEEVIEAMKRCEVFVLPSYSEGFPNVIIESMACGCNIVATSVGAIPQMLNIEHTPCGLCIPPKNTEALEKAIAWIISHKHEADQMAQRGKERVFAEYSMEKIHTQLCNIWKSLL